MKPRNLILPYTIFQISVLIAVYIIDQHKSNWLSGPLFLLLGSLGLILQVTFFFSTWSSKFYKTTIIVTIISSLIFIFFLYGFINYLVNTS